MARSDANWTNWSETWSVIIGNTTFHESYTWEYGGLTWSMSVDIPAETFSSYVSIQRTDDWAGYVTDSDPIVENMSSKLRQMAQAHGYGQYAMVDFTLRFVQTIPYLTDESIHGLPEYPQYPIEMLINGGGDCNDRSSFLAALVEARPIGLDAVLVLLPANDVDHMGVGIAGSGLYGDYYSYNNVPYYYCETTAIGWKVGEIPLDFVHDQVQIVDC
jgi:hypothetical protein